MAEMANGFGLSIKSGNDMFTVQGVDYDAFKANLKAWLDDGDAPPVLGLFNKTDEGALANVVAAFPTAQPEAPHDTAIVREPATPKDAGVVQYEVCGAKTSSGPCGSQKNQWKEGGTSAKGKVYKGFFGCPDWQSHI